MLNSRYVLAVDSSSSSVEVSLVEIITGKIFWSSSEPIKLYKPKPGWYEHDPEEIWELQLNLLNKALEQVPKESIVGIGITNQRETIVAWDKNTLKPIYRAISWQDSRNVEFIEKIRFKRTIIKEKTGLLISHAFSASKISWILKNVEHNSKTIRFGTVDSWLITKLTGGVLHFTDVTNASRTMCMNLETEDWDRELLDIFEIPISSLPVIRPSGSCFGYWNDIPILGIIGDQQAALLSLGNRTGVVQCTYGTGLFVLQNTGLERKNLKGAITTVAWKLMGQPTQYAVENGSYVCGNVLDRLYSEEIIEGYEVDISSVPISFYLESQEGRLVMFGKKKWKEFQYDLNISRTRGPKVIRAYLNALAFLVKEIIDGFEEKNIPEIHLNGNLVKIEYLKYIQSSVLEKKVTINHEGLSSVMGVTLLVLLTKELTNWRNIDEWNGYNRRSYYYSLLNTLEISFLSNLWVQYRSEL